jgi:hypothetical protein
MKRFKIDFWLIRGFAIALFFDRSKYSKEFSINIGFFFIAVSIRFKKFK